MITTTRVPHPIPLEVDLPAEWLSHDEDTGHTVWVHDGLHWSEIGFYLIDDLLVDPCAPADGFRDPPIGPTAADLVNELMSLPAYRDSTTNQVQVGGLSATVIETPQDPFHAAVDACDDSNVLGEGGHIHNPNDVAGLMQLGAYPRVWIVDVDGHRLVVVTEGQRVDEIDSILQSIRFEP